MSELITFEQSWLIPAIIATVVFIGLFVKEFLRANRKTLLLRLLLSAIAVLSLLLIVLKPSYKKFTQGTSSITLTSGYDQQDLDSLKKAISSDRVAHYDSMSYAEKVSWFGQSSSITIGDGVPAYDIPLWKSSDIKYTGSLTPVFGVQNLDFNIENYVGSDLVLQGRYQAQDSAKLVLKAVGIASDSALLKKDQTQFTLRVPLKAAGKFLFTLEEQVEDKVYSHTVPVVVQEARMNNILMLNAFPTFELKYLKNYLAEAGHKVTVRNQLTQGRYKFESYNTQPERFYRLTKQLLEKYDLIIIDQSMVDQLRKAEVDAVVSALKLGSGVLIMPSEDTFSKRTDLHNFNFRPLNDSKQSLNLPDQTFSLDSYSFKIEEDVLITTTLNATAASYRMEAGKIGTTTLKNTYQLVLKGEYDAYKYLWSSIIKPLIFIAEDEMVKSNWPLFPDEPAVLSIQGPDSISSLAINKTKLAPKQDLHIPTHWYATYWPDSSGWHQIFINSDTSWLYVNQSGEYQSLRQIQNRNTNFKVFGDLKANDQALSYWKEINLVWFYLLFLLSVGYLWLEPKLS